MLVYAANPMGYLELEGQRIYGRYFAYGSFEPKRISYDTYKRHTNALEEVPIHSKRLEEYFGVPFPDFTFQFSKWGTFPDEHIQDIATSIGIMWRRKNKLSVNETIGLKKAIRNRLDSLGF